MQNQPEYFSVFGSGSGEARRRGLREFGRSGAWRSVAGMWCVTFLLFTLGAGLTRAVGSAQAGPWFIQLYLGH